MVVFLLVVLGVVVTALGLKALFRWRRGVPIIPPRKDWKRWIPGSERSKVDPVSDAYRNNEALRMTGTQGQHWDSGSS